MMISSNISKEKCAKMLVEDEREELIFYCQSQGYTEEETERFVKNSLMASAESYSPELLDYCISKGYLTSYPHYLWEK